MQYTIYNSTKSEIREMIFFIGIVFISELIILFTLINFLRKIDRKVRIITRLVDKKRMRLKWNLCTVKELTEDINEYFPMLAKTIERTKINFIIRILNQSAQGGILLFFKPKYKKLLLAFKTGIGVGRKLLRI